MKLTRLLLHAFGPFTDAALDFTTGPADLHLIYGPNEAGKSSALRAMADLRFGIPLRSPDNFLHAYGELRISGVFVDAGGDAIGLSRRKGRGQTLVRFDPSDGPDGAELPLLPEHERTLTGGLERGEFEAMFGLDHARLREGGQRLAKGEGELGSALFEASAGTRGIAALLAALDADAKQLFNPHGRSQNAIINSARQQLDEQRRAWRQAQIRPAEWQTLHRNHETAKADLGELTATLEQLRRRDAELAELRTVEPLLQEHDRLLTELESLAGVPDLAETAREQRLAAEQARRGADQDLREAADELARCAEALESLVIEPSILEHDGVIERLCAGIEPAARARIEVRKQQATIVQLASGLAERAARIAPDRELRELLIALPSSADRVALDEHLRQVNLLGDRLERDRQQAEELARTMAADAQDPSELPDPAALHELNTALAAARELGDVRRRKAELDQQIGQLDQQLEQALADLDVDSLQKLRAARPLLDAQIAGARGELADLDAALRTNRDENTRLARDLEAQRVRQRQLAAAGEVVTADTLQDARGRRDAGWGAIRRAYIERCVDPEQLVGGFDRTADRRAADRPERSLPDTFELLLREADRQADLLRSDAERAASLADCEERIRQMEARRRELETERAEWETRHAALRDTWTQQLADAGLPNLSPEALTEWQRQRIRLLELAENGSALRDKRDRLLEDISAASRALAEALKTMAHPQTDGIDPVARLGMLIAQAQRHEDLARKAEAANSERLKWERRQRAEQAKLLQKLTETEAQLEGHLAGLRGWHERLLLPVDSTPETVTARLGELDGLDRTARELDEARLRQSQQQAVIDELEAQAANLAERLGEPAPESAESFADGLRKRLSASRDSDQQRKHLLDARRRAQARKGQAETEHMARTEVLEQLRAAAGVETIEELPALEDVAARKRETRKALATLRAQLAKASTRPEEELRSSLADLDTTAIDAERERCRSEIKRLEEELSAARKTEEEARRALEAIDASDHAAAAREAMESAAARYRGAIRPWARLRLAHGLLGEALNRFRDKARAPMISAASDYFARMTGGRYVRLVADEIDGQPVLRAERCDRRRIAVAEMSEGTADQLYLALRLAALTLRRESHPSMPLILDDVLVTSDDQRAGRILQALARFAADGQVMLFTHHSHLIEVAREALDDGAMTVHTL